MHAIIGTQTQCSIPGRLPFRTTLNLYDNNYSGESGKLHPTCGTKGAIWLGLSCGNLTRSLTVSPTSLESLLGELLRQREATVCTAESCTGGLIASRLTDISGSSAYVLGGIVAYSNSVKQNLLGVRQGTLMAYGAVSEPVAAEMALGAKDRFNSDFALSVTGIAGPGGGTPTKPVGLTYIGLAYGDGDIDVQNFTWSGDRESNKRQSADAALQMLIDWLKANPAPYSAS